MLKKEALDNLAKACGTLSFQHKNGNSHPIDLQRVEQAIKAVRDVELNGETIEITPSKEVMSVLKAIVG